MSMRKIILAAAMFAAVAVPVRAQVYYSSVTPRGWLGISFTQSKMDMNGQRSSVVVITDVTADSPARRAGVQSGDTLLRVNDFRASSELLGSMGASVEPGDTVRFVVKRGGRERDIAIVVAERPANLAFMTPGVRMDGFKGVYTIDPDSVRGRTRLFVDSIYATIDTAHFRSMFRFDTLAGFRSLIMDSVFHGALPGQAFQYSIIGDSIRGQFRALTMDSLMPSKFFEFTAPDATFNFGDGQGFITRSYMLGARAFGGADLVDLNGPLGEYFGAREGVLVVRVPDNSPAERAGLEEGDVITKVNGTSVSSAKELREAAEQAGPRTPIRLSALRHGKSVNLELKRD